MLVITVTLYLRDFLANKTVSTFISCAFWMQNADLFDFKRPLRIKQIGEFAQLTGHGEIQLVRTLDSVHRGV